MLQPPLTVIVPVRNEERHVERCLYSIARQDYPRDRLDVLVVDGMSDDATRRIIGRFAAESMLDLRLIDNHARTAAAAMNIGLAHARGEVVVRCDGHAALGPGYLRNCVDALYDTGADCVGGVLENEGETFAGRVIAAAMSSRFGVGDAAFRTGGAGVVDTVAFGAYRRDVFYRVGTFAEDIERGEDDEFNYRLREAGGVIMLVPEARATYTVRGSLGALARQYFGYGRAKPEVLRRHPRQFQVRQAVPAAFVLVATVSAIEAAEGRYRPLFAVGGIYGAVAMVASVVAGRRRGWRIVPLMPAAFACIHVAYGTGFLIGLAAAVARAMRPRAETQSERLGAPP